MTWRFEPGEPLPEAFRRVAVEETARIEAAIETSTDDPEAAIHQVRQGFKRLRGMLRLARGTLREDFRTEDRRWRDAGRLLAGAREGAVMRQTLDRVIAKNDGLPPAGLSAIRAIVEAAPSVAPTRKERRRLLAALSSGRERFAALNWPETPAELREGLKGSAARLRKRWRKAKRVPDVDTLHELRKRVKDHATHLRLLRRAAPEALSKRRETCKAVAELLGEERDLGILSAKLAEADLPDVADDARDILLKQIGKRRKVLWRRAAKAANGTFSESPRILAASLTDAWAGQGPDSPQGEAAPPAAKQRRATSR